MLRVSSVCRYQASLWTKDKLRANERSAHRDHGGAKHRPQCGHQSLTGSALILVRFPRRHRLPDLRDEAIGVLFHFANEFIGGAAKAIEVELQSAAGGFGH